MIRYFLAGGLSALMFVMFASSPLHAQGPVPAQDSGGKWKEGQFELVDGDRVVLIGNTFIEREQQHGYLELVLTLKHADRRATFRNLGWSGDVVSGLSRARFGDVNEGFGHLKRSLELTKPTVAIICYGGNEAFEGEAGLERFKQGYETLLAEVEKYTSRVVLVTPPAMENMGPPLPDPASYNENLLKYGKTIQDLAYDRGYVVADMTALSQKIFDAAEEERLTTNGLHLTDHGYWRLAHALAEELGVSTVATITDSRENYLNKTTTAKAIIPLPVDPSPTADTPNVQLQVTGLEPGTYTARVGKRASQIATGKQLEAGISMHVPELAERSELLRRTIVAKNELFFHRYRPQNETYLFLFRKHEQGNNAAEIPQFDPLIAEKEAEIFRLCRPLVVTVRLRANN